MENTGVKVNYEGQMLESNILLLEGSHFGKTPFRPVPPKPSLNATCVYNLSPAPIHCRALASETQNESNDHHDATDHIGYHGFGSVPASMKASVLNSDAGGGQVSGAERPVYKVASSGPSGKGAGH
ncbi:hypothetical protein OIU77_019419 [Salix suchowensis]|uniref:Uncharacterized protein n=1 Tax=Salix suchowensis TaxID=1278906 RepID=A0ABQ9CG46_9ROSI|nr:hypothetical protein OIU77_019419 [Salix suchowensis]